MGVELEEGNGAAKVTREMESGVNEVSRVQLPAVSKPGNRAGFAGCEVEAGDPVKVADGPPPLEVDADRPRLADGNQAVVVGTGVARVLELCGPLEVPNCVRKVSASVKPGGASAPPDR